MTTPAIAYKYTGINLYLRKYSFPRGNVTVACWSPKIKFFKNDKTNTLEQNYDYN